MTSNKSVDVEEISPSRVGRAACNSGNELFCEDHLQRVAFDHQGASQQTWHLYQLRRRPYWVAYVDVYVQPDCCARQHSVDGYSKAAVLVLIADCLRRGVACVEHQAVAECDCGDLAHDVEHFRGTVFEGKGSEINIAGRPPSV